MANSLIRRTLGASARVTGITAAALLGAVLFIGAFGEMKHAVGPFDVRLWLSAAAQSGETRISLPPAGAVTFDTHSGPVRLNIELQQVNGEEIVHIVDQPLSLQELKADANEDIQAGLKKLLWRNVAFAVLGAAIVGFVGWLAFARNRPRPGAVAALVVTAIFAVVTTVTSTSFDRSALDEPQYQGPLTQAPAVLQQLQLMVGNFDDYNAELTKQLGGVAQLYYNSDELPPPSRANTVKILHISDMHVNPLLQTWGAAHQVAEQYEVDAVIDSGDLTMWGSKPENRYLNGIAGFDVPYLFVKGNHDSATTVKAAEKHDNAVLLNQQTVTIEGLRITGASNPPFTAINGEDTTSPAIRSAYIANGESLVPLLQANPADIAVVHSPLAARQVDGLVPLVLAGHTHKREVSELKNGTTMFVQGSTGAGGYRGAGAEEQLPIEMSVLEFDPGTKELVAYDNITLGGLGESSVQIERHIVKPAETTEEEIGQTPTRP